MQKIKIENFKGYHSPAIEIEPEGKSLLVFGENGSGKSSLYEALKHFFFADKIEERLVPASVPEEEREQIMNDHWKSLRYAGDNNPSVVLVNGEDRSHFQRGDYYIFLISPEELQAMSEIRLDEQEKYWYFDGSPSSVLNECWKDLQEEVNKVLTEDFRETINIRIDRRANGDETETRVVVIDTGNGRSHSHELTFHFNESRLHLIQLLLMLEIVHLLSDRGKKNILVLDDFVTSLDAANRSFIVRYVLRNFKTFQLLVMTHSAGFYNMFRYEANLLNNSQWCYGCLYGVETTCRYYVDKKDEDLKVDISAVSDADPMALKEAGNKLRRSFEILVHRLSCHLSVGGIEESHTLLEFLNNKSILYRNGKNGADYILDEIEKLVNCNHYKETKLGKIIADKLSHYKIDLVALQEILKQMELFQKVALHPSSHATVGTGAANPVHKKELVESARILDELISLAKKIKAHEEAIF